LCYLFIVRLHAMHDLDGEEYGKDHTDN